MMACLACGSPGTGQGDGSTVGPGDMTTRGSEPAPGTTTGSTGGPGSSTSGSSSDDGGMDSTGAPPRRSPAYGDVVQKSTHNSYQRAEALVDQLAYHRARSIELDLHVGKTFEQTVPGDWFVYHTDIIDDDSSCRLLSDCLADVLAFVQAVPDHEVITLWLDLKDDWGADHSPADLDALLDTMLGEAVWSPEQLRARCATAPDLATAATDPDCGWPSLGSLRGRFVVGLTGGGIATPDTPLSGYLDQGARAFVAPSITTADALRSASPQVAIYNTHALNPAAITAAAQLGFVVRAWGANTAGLWSDAVGAGAHHVATDLVNLHQDPWTVTHDADGWPFSCRDGCVPQGPEPGAMIGVEVDSGDIWATADSMLFLHQSRVASPAGEWSAMVSTANSWVDPFAKGCLMARAGLEPDAPYFAVCRPADTEPLRTQVRVQPGQSSAATEHDIVPPDTVSPSSAAWIRLVVDDSGLCATGSGAWQPGQWTEIDTQCFDTPLTHQGLAASSHDDGTVKLLWLDPRHDGVVLDTAGLTPAAVGDAAGQGFDGPFP